MAFAPTARLHTYAQAYCSADFVSRLTGFGLCPWLNARSRAILTVLSMLVRFFRRRPMESGLLMLLQ
jgi:hypothetical protein